MSAGADIFAAARAVPIAELAGMTALRRAGPQRLAGPCPMCGGSDRSSRFQVDLSRNLWCCFACPPAAGQQVAGGDVIALERALRGGSVRDAAARLAGDAAAAQCARRPARERRSPAPRRSSGHLVRAIWTGVRPATGTTVEAWLDARRCDPAALPGGLAALRFHPRCPAAWDGGRAILHAPAMVAPILRAAPDAGDGIVWRIQGVHVTYLTEDGRAKARLVHPVTGDALPPRKVYGRLLGGVVVLSDPARLADRRAGWLVVGEGLETSWSLAARWRRLHDGDDVRVAATLSLANLQGGMLRDSAGCIDPAAPIADATARPWHLPNPGSVVIGVDADMAPLRLKVRDAAGRAVERDFGALDRAALCAALVRQHWRAAGADVIEVLRPQAGCDFNDRAREEAA